MRTQTIHAVPGMGADGRMYPTPWDTLPSFVAHNWPEFSGEASIEQIAKTACATWGVADGDVLVGASLGGMVACEITRLRRISALVLVGSAINCSEVNGLLAALKPLIDWTPFDFLRLSASSVPLDLARMFADSDGPFLRAACKAILKWEGLHKPHPPLWRIHGRQDSVIPPPTRADLLLEGGHLIAMTHPADCVAFIRNVVIPTI